MLGTAINLTTARLLNLSSHESGNFEEVKYRLLADDLKERLKRLGYFEIYKKFEKPLDEVRTKEEYTSVYAQIMQAIKQFKIQQEKLARVEAYFKRMEGLDKKSCKKFYDKLTNDYDIATIDREAKMRTTIRSFDKNGNVPPLFAKDRSGKTMTYIDKSGRERYKINSEVLDFDNFNRLAKFLQDKGLKIHVNALIWHEEVPKQIKSIAESDLDPAEKKRCCEDFLFAYINEFAKNARENGIRLDSVEVLNEIVSDDSSSKSVLRDSVWKDLMGSDYFIECYKMAKEAFSPDTKLFYNDFSEFDPVKKAKIIALVDKFSEAERRQGSPLLDGIGLQCHLYGEDYDYTSALKEYLDTAKSAPHQKEVRITELDSANCNNPSWQMAQMEGVISSAKDLGIETVSCWSDLCPFVDHLEDVNGIGLLDTNGESTNAHETLKNNFKENSKENEGEKTLNKGSSSPSDSDSGADAGSGSD